jgi:adenylate cyclase
VTALARTAWRILRSPFAWLGPEAAGSGRSLFRRTWLLLTIGVLFANFAGAVVVFVLIAWVIPTPAVDDSTRVLVTNLAAFGAYLAVSLPLGAIWANQRLRGIRSFLREERDPEPDEQKLILRAPLQIAMVAAVLWALAVAAFGVLNLTFDPLLGLGVALTVGLGGITTAAVAYLLSERLLRAATARALAARPPERPLVPGVIFRSLLAWALGTAVPIVGLLVVAVFALTDEDISRTQIAITILGLGGVALIVGLFAAVLAARAASDPVVSVRDALSKVERGDLEVQVPIYDGSEVGLLQAGFNRMVEGLRDRRRIREAFGAYVDHEVAEHILAEGVSLEGEDDHRGHIDKFVGDGFLAVFGAPRRDDEHADQGVAAAVEIARGLESDGRLEVAMGLNSGRVIAGNVGGGGRLEFSVMGDPVNVAARIEAATRETGDRILLSGETAEKLRRDDLVLEPRPDVELKGKSEGVSLFAVKLPGSAE